MSFSGFITGHAVAVPQRAPPRHRIAGVVGFAGSEYTAIEHHRQGKCFFRTLATALPDHHSERPFAGHADVNIGHPVNQAFPSPHPVRFFIRPPESALVCGGVILFPSAGTGSFPTASFTALSSTSGS